MSQPEKRVSKFLVVNALSRRAIQLENRSRRRLEFESRNSLTRAMEEFEQGLIEVEQGDEPTEENPKTIL